MDPAQSERVRRLAPQPVVAIGVSTCGLLTIAASWLRIGAGDVDAAHLLLAIGLAGSVVVAYRFPLHIRPRTKVYMASVPYYLLAVLLPPPLAATAAALGAAGGEMSVQAQRGTTAGQIATEVGRRGVVVVLGALVAYRTGDATLHTLALVGAAVVLGVGDIVTFPLLLVRAGGEPFWRVLRTTAREASLVEAAQYLLGLLGALAAAQQLWAPILLTLPTALVYVAFAQAYEQDRHERAARAQVEEALRIRDDFLTAASHDLRTPLTVIQGFAQLVQLSLESDTPLDKGWLSRQMHTLGEGATRMAHTVEDITDVAQLQIGQALSLQLDEVDVSALVRQVAAGSLVPVSGGKTAPVVVDAPTPVLIRGDRRRLERVVQNIIGNAVKYSPQGTPVQVEVRRDEQRIVLRVRDQGIGIPAAEVPHVFERFYRASTAQGIKGSGIGLAGAKMIVEQHGGHMAVESTVGRGTIVTIWLPRGGAPQGV